ICGTECRVIGWNAHQRRSSSVIAKPFASVSGSGASTFAPPAIHFLIVSISAAESFFLVGGISPLFTRSRSRLASGLPSVIAGPDLPPLRTKRRRRRSSPPFGFSASPWHSVQYAWKIGRTSALNAGAFAGSAAAAGAPSDKATTSGLAIRGMVNWAAREGVGGKPRRVLSLIVGRESPRSKHDSREASRMSGRDALKVVGTLRVLLLSTAHGVCLLLFRRSDD